LPKVYRPRFKELKELEETETVKFKEEVERFSKGESQIIGK